MALAALSLGTVARPDPPWLLSAGQHPRDEQAHAPDVPSGAALVPLPPPRLLTLRNGLRVVLAPDPALTVTYFDLRVAVGSRDAPEGYHGLPHLLEHMLFTGTRELDVRAYYARLRGMDAEDYNGLTGDDSTHYVATVPEARLPELLWLESQRMALTPAAWTPRALAHERRVVQLEARERQLGRPLFNVLERALEALYPQGHPYRVVRESDDDLAAITQSDLEWFWQRHYTPSRMVLTLVGGALPATLEPLLGRYFGALAVQPPAPAPAAPPALPLPAPSTVEVHDRVRRGAVLLAWHSPARLAPGDAAYDLLASLLDSPLPGSLREGMTRGSRRVRELSIVQRSRELGSLFVVIAQPDASGLVTGLARELQQQLALPETTALVRAELGTVQARLRAELAAQRFLVGERARLLGEYASLRGVADGEAQELARFDSVTAADVVAALEALRRQTPTVVTLSPGYGW